MPPVIPPRGMEPAGWNFDRGQEANDRAAMRASAQPQPPLPQSPSPNPAPWSPTSAPTPGQSPQQARNAHNDALEAAGGGRAANWGGTNGIASKLIDYEQTTPGLTGQGIGQELKSLMAANPRPAAPAPAPAPAAPAPVAPTAPQPIAAPGLFSPAPGPVTSVGPAPPPSIAGR